MFRLLVVLSELGMIGTTLGIFGGSTPLLLLVAVVAAVLFLWGRPLTPEK